MSSRIYQEIREKLGLCYSIYSFRSYYTDVALWTIYANTTPEMAVKLIDSIEKILKELFTVRITEGELADAKTHLKGSLILTQEETEVRMKRLYRLWNSYGTVLEFEESMRMIDEVTFTELDGIIKQVIVSKDFNLFAYGNKKAKKIERMRFDFNE
jgi:predicted Zn-dependent peptidase